MILDTGYMKPQLMAVRPDGHGDVTKSHVTWEAKGAVPANPSPIVVGENLYMVSDQGVLSCLEVRTGRERFKSRLGGNFSASPIGAEGRIYFWSEEGETIIIEAADKLREVARIPSLGRIMATPAVVGRAIYLRTEDALYRIEQGGVASSAAAGGAVAARGRRGNCRKCRTGGQATRGTRRAFLVPRPKCIFDAEGPIPVRRAGEGRGDDIVLPRWRFGLVCGSGSGGLFRFGGGVDLLVDFVPVDDFAPADREQGLQSVFVQVVGQPMC